MSMLENIRGQLKTAKSQVFTMPVFTKVQSITGGRIQSMTGGKLLGGGGVFGQLLGGGGVFGQTTSGVSTILQNVRSKVQGIQSSGGILSKFRGGAGIASGLPTIQSFKSKVQSGGGLIGSLQTAGASTLGTQTSLLGQVFPGRNPLSRSQPLKGFYATHDRPDVQVELSETDVIAKRHGLVDLSVVM